MKKNINRVLFSAAFIIPLFIFYVIPLILSLMISFTDWDYISPTYNIVGLENYKYLFSDTYFHKALWNTVYFGVCTILPTIAIGLIFALLLEKKLRFSNVYRAVIFSPWVTPAVAVSFVWTWLYDPEKGLFNYILQLFGMEPLQWLHSSDTAMLGIIIFTIWQSVGWTMLFYISALGKVPKSCYEAADIDGAGYFKKLFKITLPLISPTTYFLFVINLINSMQVYDQIEIMTQGGPGGSTTTLLYMYYDKAFQNFQMGMANAVAMIIFVITIILTIISKRLAKKNVYY